MSKLDELRQSLDALDTELVALFEKRMGVSLQVAAYKQANGLPVLDAGREEQVLASRAAMLRDPTLAPAVRSLYQSIMALSRQAQQVMLEGGAPHD